MNDCLDFFRITKACIGVFAFSCLNAQTTPTRTLELKFEDGRVITADIVTDEPDEMFSQYYTVLPMANHLGVTNEVSYQKIVVNEYLLKGGVMGGYAGGFGGLTVSGIYYLGSSERYSQQRIRLKAVAVDEYTVKKYSANIPCTVGRYWGVHSELGYNRVGITSKLGPYNLDHYTLHSVSSLYAAAGVGLNIYQGAQVYTEGIYIGGTTMFTAVADLLINPIMSINATGRDSIGTTTKLKAKDISNGLLGFHAYLQLHNTIVYRKANQAKNTFGYTARVGIIKSGFYYTEGTVKGIGDKIAIELGAGFFFAFL